jgi:predicted DNA-binding ArsR family transcriptional regulator
VSRKLPRRIVDLQRRALAALAAHGGWMTFPELSAAVSPDAGAALGLLPTPGLVETRPVTNAAGLADAEVRITDAGRKALAGVQS